MFLGSTNGRFSHSQLTPDNTYEVHGDESDGNTAVAGCSTSTMGEAAFRLGPSTGSPYTAATGYFLVPTVMPSQFSPFHLRKKEKSGRLSLVHLE